MAWKVKFMTTVSYDCKSDDSKAIPILWKQENIFVGYEMAASPFQLMPNSTNFLNSNIIVRYNEREGVFMFE